MFWVDDVDAMYRRALAAGFDPESAPADAPWGERYFHIHDRDGFDNAWLKAAGVTHEQMIEVVKNTASDGEVCDWVRQNIKKTDTDKRAHAEGMMNYPKADDAAMQDRLKQRKESAGLSHRTDLTTFVDFIDADEKRS